MNKNKNIAVVYSHHKLGDLIWQLPYIKSISENFNQPITLITRSKTQSKDILKDENYIKDFFYCEFRKGIWYFIEVLKLYLFFKKKNFSHVFILDKISRPAIAAKFSNIKNIIGPGIKNQKKWLTCKKFLSYEDYKILDYSNQSKKLLEMNKIKVSNVIPSIEISKDTLRNLKPNLENLETKKISFGVDSFELYKMWYEEMFAELGERLIEEKIADEIYLIAGPKNKSVSQKIISLSKYRKFHDCSNLNLLQVIKVIKHSNFFVGNNSGPLNLASALNIKAFGLIANAKVSELRNSNILPILPLNYKNEFLKNRNEMKRLSVDIVFNEIKKNLD